MRRKSIGATSQAFHEPMSTGAFLEFLTGGLVGQVLIGLGPGPAAEMLERRREPASHGTVQLRLRKPSNPPQVSGLGTSQLRFFRKPPGGSLAKAWVSAETAASEVGTWRETKPGYPPYPPPPAFWGCKGEKEEGFHPLRLRQPSNTPPKVGGPQAP